MVITLRWHIGIQKDKDGNRIPFPHVPVSKARAILIDKFGGSTEYESVGCWKDPATNTVVRETALVFEAIITEDPDLVVAQPLAEAIAAQLRDLFNQSCVLWTASPGIGGFV